MVGQKRTRTLADIRAEVAQKKQRPSVITYCQPRQQPMPVRVIKSVQKVCLFSLFVNPNLSQKSFCPIRIYCQTSQIFVKNANFGQKSQMFVKN